MKKSVMLGAMALGVTAVSTAARARNYEFGFYTDAGTPFCDGVKFSGDSGSGAGYHIYDEARCAYPKALLGGFDGTVPKLGPGKWYSFPVSQAPGDQLSPAYVEVFYINVKALTWVLAYESTDYGIPFNVSNSGVLMKGKPDALAKPGQKRLGSVIAESIAAKK